MTKTIWCVQLEGAISSGEKRLQGQAKELATYKVRCHCNMCVRSTGQRADWSMMQERCEELVAKRDTLLSQVGITPERCQTERASLQAKTKK